MELDVRQVFRLVRRWWWLLLLVPMVAGAMAYGISSRQTRLYSASAVLLITPAQGTGALDYSALINIDRLVDTYRELIRTPTVLAPVVGELSLRYDAAELQKKVSTSSVPGTQLFRVNVSDPEPQRAAEIANAIAGHFGDYIGQQLAQLSQSSRTALDQQIAETKRQIDAIAQQVQTLDRAPNSADPAVQAELASLRATLERLQQTYAQFLLTAQTMDLNIAAAKAQVTVADQAAAPAAPYAPRIAFAMVVGAFAGLLLAGGAIVLLGYLDNTAKIDTDYVALAGAPLLATISRVPRLRGGRKPLFQLERPTSEAAEAIRFLRTSLEIAAAPRAMTSLAISSPGSSEGKSTVAANLAVAVAQAGFSTVLIDTDLRKPSQHRIFRVPNERGLTTLLLHPDRHPWRELAADVGVRNLALLPSGPLPPIPADFLSLDRLRRLLTEIGESVDVILLDTAPILAVSDALVVATNVDGVLLVARAGHTRLDALRRAAASMQHRSIRLVGIVLNQQTGATRTVAATFKPSVPFLKGGR